MILIGIAGKARSGKDTVADMLVEQGMVKYSFAAPLKAGVRVMFGLTRDHTDGDLKEDIVPWIGRSPRYLMQTIGTEYGRELVATDIWLRCAERVIADAEESGATGLVIPDVRFDNEAEWLRGMGGLLVHLHRPDADKVQAHRSEAGVSPDWGDYTISNHAGLDALRRNTLDMLEYARNKGKAA